MWLFKPRTGQIRKVGATSYLRVCAGATLTVWMVTRPVPLTSVRWWLSPDVASSIQLTTDQRHAIDRLYGRHLAKRGPCIERVVEATNRVDQLLRDGSDLEDSLRETQAAALAAAEQQALSDTLNNEISAVLSEQQRRRLAVLISERIFE